MKKIKIPVYNQDVFIYDNYEDADKYAVVETPPLSLRYNKDNWDLPMLAHETSHVVNFMLAGVGQGMPYKDIHGYYDDEFYAYLYAEVFKLIFNKTKQDIKELKHEPRRKRTKKMLQHPSKKTSTEESRAEEVVIN